MWAGKDPYYKRETWDAFDPTLLSEGMFGAGMIVRSVFILLFIVT